MGEKSRNDPKEMLLPNHKNRVNGGEMKEEEIKGGHPMA